ncbi:hypothetical protein GCM10022240_24980 [Microbacterium kribbense]|uniref:Dioxygenase n=1 Tax=Microbacterium kribbense TaxID=433645 RepID=A0ABP7GRC7_9MICO
MAAGDKKKDARAQRERARVYQARQAYSAARSRRRIRDNWIGGVAGGVLLLGVLGVQITYYTAGPGKPAPAPTPTTTSTVTPTPVSPTPTPTTAG